MFVDTGGFFAAHVAEDRWHSHAATALQSLLAKRVRLVSTNLVLGETYTLLRIRYGQAAAWRFMDALDRSPSLQRIQVDAEADAAAWTLLRRYKDQAFSYVDATSFAVMRAHKLRRALAFDSHFATAGFSRIPLDTGK
ncbi:MAG: PIN domain-containing protein [Myxococcota bacterium]|nr:PIN domain-containing protein [Myxococcota bacterium]